MIVYLITAGSYSDYSVYSVALSKEDAEDQARRMSQILHESVNVEMRDTDLLKNIMSGLFSRFDFRIDCGTGSIVKTQTTTKDDWCGLSSMVRDCSDDMALRNTCYDEHRHQFLTTVYATDYETAEKTAHDRYAQFMAEKAGIT